MTVSMKMVMITITIELSDNYHTPLGRISRKIPLETAAPSTFERIPHDEFK
ncbi:hypothetical protein EV213_108178 [Aureibacillus halotolerans]|uniref:Uncharacterized protein n=1 Tax=Aureibacillus halotolerans TaxID=1508390 RepID=A0A4R6U0N2_9BACI|nr:hypothetical protein EV213_108178 [Aureibacillus halotolerans]